MGNLRLLQVVALALLLANCRGSNSQQENSSAGAPTAAQQSPLQASLTNDRYPEPPGGCRPILTTGACGMEGGHGAPKCVNSVSQCLADEVPIKDYPACHINHACGVEQIADGREGTVVAKEFLSPAKGGELKDVSSSDPSCDSLSSDASRCHWDCVVPPTGMRIDVQHVSFTAKNVTGAPRERSFSWTDPNANGWQECSKDGADCPIGWSKWEAIQIAEDHVCGRFKNWSHNLSRLVKIQARLVP